MGKFRMRTVAAVAATMASIGACGGGDDGAADGLAGDVTLEADANDGGGDADDGGEQVDGAAGSFEVVDDPTIAVDPGIAVVEVDGRRLEYPMAGAIHVVCDVTPEAVQVNIQTPEGHSVLLRASNSGGSWIGSLTAAGDDPEVSYGSDFTGGRMGIGETAVSYEGPIDKVVDRDILNAEALEGTVAVNCETPGGDPAATVGDQAYTFPVSGAQSFDCDVAADAFEIRVNRLAVDGLQLEMQGRDDGAQWVGAVVVYTADGNWTAPLPLDGTGLTIDGGTVTFDGTFSGPDDDEVPGSATATCF